MMKLKQSLEQTGESEMVGIKYPKEIEEAYKKVIPYWKEHRGNFDGAPEDIIEAYELIRKWAWEQEQ